MKFDLLMKKLFGRETSPEERDLICGIAYGKTFSESLDEIRHDDFVEGLKRKLYRVISVKWPDAAGGLQVEFILGEFAILNFPPSVLYESDAETFCRLGERLDLNYIRFTEPFGPDRYTYRVNSAYADKTLTAALREHCGKNGMRID